MGIAVLVQVKEGLVMASDSSVFSSGSDYVGHYSKYYYNQKKIFQVSENPVGIISIGNPFIGNNYIEDIINNCIDIKTNTKSKLRNKDFELRKFADLFFQRVKKIYIKYNMESIGSLESLLKEYFKSKKYNDKTEQSKELKLFRLQVDYKKLYLKLLSSNEKSRGLIYKKLKVITDGLSNLGANPVALESFGFILGGYSSSSNSTEQFEFTLPFDMEIRQLNDFGAAWRGSTLPITRLYHGYDLALLNDLNNTFPNSQKAISEVLSRHPLRIDFRNMTLNEGIDFARFIIEMTTKISRFCVNAPEVGGPIQLAIITKNKRFLFVDNIDLTNNG